MKTLQNNTITLIISLGILGFAVNSVINLSLAPIDTIFGATWMFVSIVLTLAGLFIAPVLVMVSLGGIVKNMMQPERKPKHKNQI